MEGQWLTEVPKNAGASFCQLRYLCGVLKDKSGVDIDYDPAKKAREERKARVAKNEKQHEKNLLHTQKAQGSTSSAPQDQRKREIDRTLATTRVSTASMGRFDKKLEGEKKLKGAKRKVCYCPVDPAGCFSSLSSSLMRQKSLRIRRSHKTYPSCQNSIASPRRRKLRAVMRCLTYGKLSVLRARARAAPHWQKSRVGRRERKASGKHTCPRVSPRSCCTAHLTGCHCIFSVCLLFLRVLRCATSVHGPKDESTQGSGHT